MKFTAGTIMAEAVRDFRRAWPQLIVTDISARGLALLVLAPIVGLLLKAFLALTTTGAVSDAAIADFLVHPTGIAALLVVATVSLAIILSEAGQVMVIGYCAGEGLRATWLDALKFTVRHATALVVAALYAVVRLLLIAVPFVAACGALYALFLRAHDINYYLAAKPPVFLAVAGAAGLMLATALLLMVSRVSLWVLALPMVLFDGMGGREAMRASEKASAPYRWKFAGWLTGWFLAVFLVTTLAAGAVARLGDVLVPRDASSLNVMVLGLSVALFLSTLVSLVMTALSTVLFPLLIVRVYRGMADTGGLKPRLAGLRMLSDSTGRGIPGKGFLAGGMLALAIVIVGGFFLARDPEWRDKAQIIAHRGGAAVSPENTMAAFQRGIADGADWLELDVQENADGVVVVAHDRDFMRIARNSLEVWKATNEDLDGIDLGSYFGAQFSNQRTPTLLEVLNLAKGSAGLFIELKYYGKDVALESKVAELVRTSGMASRVSIMSLEYDGVRKAAALEPSWNYGLLSAVAIGDLTRLRVNFLALSSETASFSMIRRAHKRGMKVYAWTVNDPVQMSVMMSRGVDGIITDQVALAQRVKDLRAKLTPFGRFVVWMAGESGLLRRMNKISSRDDA